MKICRINRCNCYTKFVIIIKKKKKNDYLVQTMDDHVLLLAAQGAQKKIRTAPPPRIKASMAKIVHTVEKGVTQVDSNLLAAGKSTISSVLKPNLLALPSKNLRRLDAFSQDISFYFACTFIKISIYCVPFVFIIVFSMLKMFLLSKFILRKIIFIIRPCETMDS